jgi:hypothetical protein
MGREIRRVPKGWEHPRGERGLFVPLHDEDYGTAISEWIDNHQKWLRGEHEDQIADPALKSQYQYFAQWAGGPPNVAEYRQRWESEPVCYQLYENVSEGTPVSPVFETPEALIDYLVANGDFWDQQRGEGRTYSRPAAENVVHGGYAPSLVIGNGQVMHGAEGIVAMRKSK